MDILIQLDKSIQCCSCVYTFLGVTTWYWIAIRGLIHGEDSFLINCLYLITWMGVPWDFPSSIVACQLVFSLFRSYLGNHTVESSWSLEFSHHPSKEVCRNSNRHGKAVCWVVGSTKSSLIQVPTASRSYDAEIVPWFKVWCQRNGEKANMHWVTTVRNMY